MARDGDPGSATRLAGEGLALLPENEIDARTDALRRLAAAAWWPGDLRQAEVYTREAIALAAESRTARPLGARHDDAAMAARASARARRRRADALARDARASGRRRARAGARAPRARLAAAHPGQVERGASRARRRAAALPRRRRRGRRRLVGAPGRLDRRRRRRRGNTASGRSARRCASLPPTRITGICARPSGRSPRRCSSRGRIEEAERHALAARALVSPHDLTSLSSTTTTLGLVRAAQGRDAEAEELLRESFSLLVDTDYRLLEVAARVSLVRFLRGSGRDAEAAELEAGLPDPVPGWLGSEDALQRRAGLARLAEGVDQEPDRGRRGDRDHDRIGDQREPQRTLASGARYRRST